MDLNKVDSQIKLFQEGGIADDGMERDPVSGNEVPPGSLASEVRDDIDAKLSEGEYVVPADVVRYYGVAYFEKLRNKAKQGLADMEADGRIGGEPMPEGLGSEDDLPFSDEELMFTEDEPLEMAEGGSVRSTFNPQAFQPGFSFGMGGGGTGGIVTKTYRNAAGEVRSIMFVNGQPIQTIPAGFYEDTPENRAKFATPETVAPTTGVASVSTQVGQEERGGGVGDQEGSGTSFGGAASSSGIGKDIGTPVGGYGQMGTVGTVGLGALAGLALGGVKGAIAGGREGKDIADFNDARNDLAEAVQSNDISAIGKAAKSVEETFAELGKVGKAATNTLGMTAKDAVNAVGYGAQGAGTSSRGEFGYGLSEAQQAAASPDASGEGGSFFGMDTSSAGYTDPYGEGFGPGGVNAGPSFGAGTQGAADVDAAVAEAMGGYGGSSGGTSFGGGASSGGGFGTGEDGTSGGGGGDGGGGKVICTALNSLGLLPDDVYKLDQEFGRLADQHDPALTRGYRRWATPVAEYIKKDTLLSKATRYAIKPLANAWAKEMAYQMDPVNYKGSFVGKILMAIGHPICRKLGKG